MAKGACRLMVVVRVGGGWRGGAGEWGDKGVKGEGRG